MVPVRVKLAFLVALGIIVLNMSRMSLPFVIVPMINITDEVNLSHFGFGSSKEEVAYCPSIVREPNTTTTTESTTLEEETVVLPKLKELSTSVDDPSNFSFENVGSHTLPFLFKVSFYNFLVHAQCTIM